MARRPQAEPGSLSLRDRLALIEGTLESLKRRVDVIIYILLAAAGSTAGFSGLEAIARTWP